MNLQDYVYRVNPTAREDFLVYTVDTDSGSSAAKILPPFMHLDHRYPLVNAYIPLSAEE